MKAVTAVLLALGIWGSGLRAEDRAVVTLSLKNGSAIRGELVSQDERSIQLRTKYGDVRISRADLVENSNEKIERNEVATREELERRCAELQKRVSDLEAENARLRATPTPSPTASPANGGAPVHPSQSVQTVQNVPTSPVPPPTEEGKLNRAARITGELPEIP